jgi:hypothetical protein
MTTPTLADLIGPRRAALFREIMGAWLSTAADDRQPIDGRAIDGGIRLLHLLHPRFSGRDVTARPEDIDALVTQGLLTQSISSGYGDRTIEPSRRIIQALQESVKQSDPEE